nr:unnamed protein product [Callosobruchus analis]
MAWLLQ